MDLWNYGYSEPLETSFLGDIYSFKAMGKADWTSSRDANKWFQTTQWSEIRQLRESDDSLHKALLESLLTRYWSPVFWYIRKKGYDHNLAKDLTQGYFHEIVLGRGLFDHARQAKGRLRNFLLVALERYLASFERRRSAQKRRPLNQMISLEEVNLPEPATADSPEQAYSRAWAAELLDKTLAELCEVCHRSGKGVQWAVFHDRVLAPIFDDSAMPSFRDICRLYSIENEATASNMVTTVKRRFRSILRRHLRESVGAEEDIDTELMELLRIFGG